MKIIFKNTAAEILILLIIVFVVSGSTTAVELEELTIEEIRELKLFENPSTGYRWKLKIENPQIIRTVGEEYQSLISEGGSTGRGGIHSWNFKAEEKGVSLVEFNLLRADEQKIIRQKRYIFVVDLITAEISVEEILEIELAENPSTGYRWQLDLAENENVQLLQQKYIDFTASSETNNKDQTQSEKEGRQILVGRGGIKNWTFRGTEVGYQILTFKLTRSGEDESIKTVEYLVLVD